jgi:NTP pyrophosphatase (non-canonical NTP hydrolase)
MNRVQYEERKAIYKEAIRKWGVDKQCLKAVEEMSELTKELCKIGIGQGDMEALAEEIADVSVMLEQLRLIYDLNDKVCAYMDAKVRRLQSRVSKGGTNERG